MKVVLVATHQLSVGNEAPLTKCLGVLYLAACLREKKIECEVLDFFGRSLFYSEDREQALKDISSDIVSSNPTILGFSTMSSNLVLALDICKQIKDAHPEIYTVLGGPGVAFAANEVLREFPYIDAIVRGEADEAFPDLVQSIIEGQTIPRIDGLVHRVSGVIVDNGWPKPILELDSIPMPLYSLCAKEEYEIEPTWHIEAGRGCPYGCNFCSTSVFFSRKYRMKSVDRILNEIEEITKYSKNRRISFNHDLLTFDREFILELCDALSRLNPGIRWGSSARLDSIDPEILMRMKEAGCDSLFLGFEVASPKMQAAINKKLNLDNLDDVFKALVDLDYNFTASFIVGFPEEEESDLIALWCWVLKIKSMARDKVRTQIHALSPEPGSRIYQEQKKKLVYDDFGAPGHSDFPPLEWARLRNMIKAYPEIFPIYFTIQRSDESRGEMLKHTLMGRILQAHATISLLKAYQHLGDDLATAFVSRINELELPLPKGPKIRISVLMESMHKLILNLFQAKGICSKQYDTAAQTEIALAKVLDPSSNQRDVIIHTPYDPIELMSRLVGREESKDLEERDRYTAFFWDEKSREPKITEVPESYVSLVSES